MDRQRRERLRRAVDARGQIPGRADWARSVCEACVTVIGNLNSAALTLRATSRAQEMLGASDEWGAGLEHAQYTLGEGPGVTAFTTGAQVLAADLRGEQERWPSFADAALSGGAAAAFAFPLRVGAIRIGTLDLYRRRVGDLLERMVTDAATLADLAAFAIIEHAEPAERGSANWTRPAVSYQEVNMATGMLAAHLRIRLDDAFARLRAHAFAEGRSILEVARDVLDRKIPVERLAD